MNSYQISHHDPKSKGYEFHVIQIKNTDFCLGCLASKFFLIAILPLLSYFFIYPNYIVSLEAELAIFGLLWLCSFGVFLVELFQGLSFNLKFARSITNVYFVTSILYVGFVNSTIASPAYLSIIFAIPQISLYAYKIYHKKEFTNRLAKFIVRISFISAFFFALNGLSSSLDFYVLYIGLSGIIFIKLRSFSKYRVDEDTSLQYNVMMIGGLFAKYIDINGRFRSLNHLPTLKKLGIFAIFSILFTLGFIGLTPVVVCSSMTSNSLILTAAGAPLVSMSSKKYCSNCGAPLTANDRFCESCGVQVDQSKVNQQQSGGYQPYGGGQQPRQQSGGYQPYDSGYQRPYGQQRYGNRHSTSAPILFGFVVGIVVLMLTGNLILAVILGFVGYFGAKWAESVDNPCLAFCIMDQCCDCICSATESEMQRKGRF